MTISIQLRRGAARLVSACLAAVLLPAGTVYAQPSGDCVAARVDDVMTISESACLAARRDGVPAGLATDSVRSTEPTSRPRLFIRSSLVSLAALDLVSNGAQVRSPGDRRSKGHKAAATLFGIAGGFYLGGFIGSRMEGPCYCEDPGLKGAIVGAPIGAVIGGILGARFL